jgi:hypothetical protein
MDGLRDLTNKEYHLIRDYYGSSSLTLIRRSRRQFHDWFNGREIDVGEGALLGSALDAKVCESFDDEFVVCPKVDRRTKLGKIEWEEFQESSGGKEVLTEVQAIRVERMFDSLWSNKLAREVLLEADGLVQKSFFWKSRGLPMKCRWDFLVPRQYVVDLKCRSVVPRGKSHLRDWIYKVKEWDYHVQAAHYLNGQALAFGRRVDFWYHVTVEHDYPYRTWVYRMKRDHIVRGESRLTEACSRLRKYLQMTSQGLDASADPEEEYLWEI